MEQAQKNLAAFLSMIREAEGTSGPNGYRTLFGGGLFDSFDDHPRQPIKRKSGKGYITSTAAGAYKMPVRVWDECHLTIKLPDFSPRYQDEAARFLISRRRALWDVFDGRFYSAVGKCNKEWASLPGSPYDQPTINLLEALALYTKAGGINVEEKPNVQVLDQTTGGKGRRT